MLVTTMRKELDPPHHRPATTSLSICALGFGTVLEEKLGVLFRQQSTPVRGYHLVPPTAVEIDVLLVNFDNPLARRKKDLLVQGLCHQAKLVAVSQGELSEPVPYHLRGPLTPAKLMALLNSLPMPTPPASAPNQAQSATVLNYPNPVPPKAYSAPASAQLEPPAIARYRALVVDDSLAIQKSLALKLSGLAQIAAVEFADNGSTALAMAETGHYDLIFLDVMMPGLDGYETCTQLRANPRYKKTPIIMVSGKTSPLDEVKGIMAGCTTYLTKPVQDEPFQKLSVRVLAWLTEHGNPQTEQPPLRH